MPGPLKIQARIKKKRSTSFGRQAGDTSVESSSMWNTLQKGLLCVFSAQTMGKSVKQRSWSRLCRQGFREKVFWKESRGVPIGKTLLSQVDWARLWIIGV